VADHQTLIEMGFVVRGYTGLGRRVEDEEDLATLDDINFFSGALHG
jgi:hypothetical protein